MPPKPRYDRNDIASIALEIIKQDGMDMLTARELGKRLGTSVSPVFTMFGNMDEVKQAARGIALSEFKEYIGNYIESSPALKRVCTGIVSYGMQFPELFKLVFMAEPKNDGSFCSVILDFEDVLDVCIRLLKQDYEMTQNEAMLFFEQMWTQAFGLGAMCAMRMCTLSEEETEKRLNITFSSLLMLVKSGKLLQIYSKDGRVPDERPRRATIHDLPYYDEQF